MSKEDYGQKKHWGTIIIGGGQAGLATGYHLQKLKEDFIILDASEKTGDTWRNRWDSLRLFTPRWANALPGAVFPPGHSLFPGKDETADYLSGYSISFGLPVMNQTRILRVEKKQEGYELTHAKGIFTCNNLVIASGSYTVPKIPAFAKNVDPEIYQVHAAAYRRPAELPPGDVLIVGAGTSGIQIAIDVAVSKRKTYLSGTPPAQIPYFAIHYLGRPFIWVLQNIITLKTVMGRKAQTAIKSKGGGSPLIGISVKDAQKAGAMHVGRVQGLLAGYPVLEDGTVMNHVSSVIWCTGFSNDFSWINIENITDEKGYLLGTRGVSEHKGLYFVGMVFQYGLTSNWINGVGRDAAYVAAHINSNK